MKDYFKLYIPYVFSIVGNIILAIIQETYLSGLDHNYYLDIDGITLIRDRAIETTSNAIWFSAFIILVIAIILSVKISKKYFVDSKFKLFTYNIITIIICLIQFSFVSSILHIW